MKTLSELRTWARAEGRQRVGSGSPEDYSVEMADRHVDLLLQKALNLSAVDLVISPERPIANDEFVSVRNLVLRFVAQEPLAYLLGSHEFCGEEFLVTRDVLIPRNETELLVTQAATYANSLAQPVVVVEVGVGSGAILISLCHRIANLVAAIGVEISEAALAIARQNVEKFGCQARIDLIHGDLLKAIQFADTRNRTESQPPIIVVANLPYIDRSETLPASVRDFEPALALYAESGGLAKIIDLIEQAAGQMRDADRLFLEIGAGQFARVKSALLSQGLSRVTAHLDHQGIERVVEAGCK